MSADQWTNDSRKRFTIYDDDLVFGEKSVVQNRGKKTQGFGFQSPLFL